MTDAPLLEDKTFDGPETLLGGLQRRAQGDPRRVFLEDARASREVTFGSLADVTAAWTGRNPIAEPVALVIADPLTFAVTYIALVALGTTVVPLDPSAPSASNLRLMEKARSRTVIADANLSWAPRLIRADLRGPVQPDAVSEALRSATHENGRGAVLLFSSGSTGERKLIRLEESQLLRTADVIADHHQLGPGERGYNSLPLHHVNAEVVGVLATLRAGATLILDAGFHKTGFWKLMHDRAITWVNAVPAIIAILAGEPDAGYDTSAIRFVRSASAPLPVAVLQRFEAQHQIRILETYGMTEAASQITANPLDGVRKPGSAGLPVGIDLRIIAADGTVAPPGAGGTVEIRGAGVVTSYVDGVADDRFTVDRWLDTGDQGYVDEDGYLFLVGRTDDVINRGGEKMFPREIEEVLLRDPAVREAVVAPLADPIVGQLPIAFVTVASDTDTTSRLQQLCTDSLPRFMRPVSITVLEELPKGVTGKISRRKASELAECGQGGS